MAYKMISTNGQIQYGIDDDLQNEQSDQNGIGSAVAVLLYFVKVKSSESGYRFYEQIREYVGVERGTEEQLTQLIFSEHPHSDLDRHNAEIQYRLVDTCLFTEYQKRKDRSDTRQDQERTHRRERDV